MFISTGFYFYFHFKNFFFFQKRLYFYSVSGSEKNDFYEVTFSSLISSNPMKCLSTECSFSSVFFLLLSKRAEKSTVPFFVVIFSFKSFSFPFFYARHWSGMLVVNMFSFYLPAFLLYLSVFVCSFIVVIVFCHSLPPSPHKPPFKKYTSLIKIGICWIYSIYVCAWNKFLFTYNTVHDGYMYIFFILYHLKKNNTKNIKYYILNINMKMKMI